MERPGVGVVMMAAAIFAMGQGCAHGPAAPTRGGFEEARIIEPHTGMELIRVPGGSLATADGRGPVTLSTFYLGRTEVTQAQWEKVMGSNPSRFRGSDRPVEQVGWADAQEFLKRLGALTGRPYRLPTEAEWEYAARSGGRAERWAGTSDPNRLGDFAWYRGNSGRETHPVGSKLPNGLGLHDMSGNVWEWCQDYYGESFPGQPGAVDPQGPAGGAQRVERGGSWDNDTDLLRTDYRHYSDPTWILDALGFRVALSAGG